jgi:hypothetical protein
MSGTACAMRLAMVIACASCRCSTDVVPELSDLPRVLVISTNSTLSTASTFVKTLPGVSVWEVEGVPPDKALDALRNPMTSYLGWDDEWHWLVIWRSRTAAEVWKTSLDGLSPRRMTIFLLELSRKCPQVAYSQRPSPQGLWEYMKERELRTYLSAFREVPTDQRVETEEEVLRRLKAEERAGIPDPILAPVRRARGPGSSD